MTMLLEHIWSYMGIIILVVFYSAKIVVPVFLEDSAIVTVYLSLWNLIMAYMLSASSFSAPFVPTRFAISATVVIIYAETFAPVLDSFYQHIGVSEHEVLVVVGRVVYSLIWLLLAIAVMIVITYSNGKPIPAMIWFMLFFLTVVIGFIPIEPDVFTPNQTPWLWVTRMTFLFILWMLLSMSDLLNVLRVVYNKRAQNRETSIPLSYPVERQFLITAGFVWVAFVWRYFLAFLPVVLAWAIILIAKRWSLTRDAYNRWNKVRHSSVWRHHHQQR